MAKTGAKGRTMTPEVKAAYAQVESGVRSLGKSVEEIQRTLRQAERRIEPTRGRASGSSEGGARAARDAAVEAHGGDEDARSLGSAARVRGRT
jgi:hypothetical protein